MLSIAAGLVDHGMRTLDLCELGLKVRESLVECALEDAGFWGLRLLHVTLILSFPLLDIDQLFPCLV